MHVTLHGKKGVADSVVALLWLSGACGLVKKKKLGNGEQNKHHIVCLYLWLMTMAEW